MKLRLRYYSPWKHSKLLEDSGARVCEERDPLGRAAAKGSLLSQAKFASESCENTGVPRCQAELGFRMSGVLLGS